ncbi:MAG: hypothetical protein IJF08_08760, partial [Clostridia bacterium]|nr:hypothetical protein [Clostridia bacterium]
ADLSDPFIFSLGHIAYMPCGKSFGARKNLLCQNCIAPVGECIFDRFWCDFAKQICSSLRQRCQKERSRFSHIAFQQVLAIIDRQRLRQPHKNKQIRTASM